MPLIGSVFYEMTAPKNKPIYLYLKSETSPAEIDFEGTAFSQIAPKMGQYLYTENLEQLPTTIDFRGSIPQSCLLRLANIFSVY